MGSGVKYNEYVIPVYCVNQINEIQSKIEMFHLFVMAKVTPRWVTQLQLDSP